MSKVYVAFREAPAKPIPKPRMLASNSQTKLKADMREHIGSEWTVALYDLKPNVETLCALAMGKLKEMDAESSTRYRVNDSGQLREIVEKPKKK